MNGRSGYKGDDNSDWIRAGYYWYAGCRTERFIGVRCNQTGCLSFYCRSAEEWNFGIDISGTVYSGVGVWKIRIGSEGK